MLWYAKRPVSAAEEILGDWGAPVIHGRIGLDGIKGDMGNPGLAGVNGHDGPGFETIYKLTANIDPLVLPSNANSWPYDIPQDGWSDAAGGLTAALPVLQWSQRKVTGEVTRGQAPGDDWGNWDAPTVLTRIGDAGADGLDATNEETVYRITSTTAIPTAPPDLSPYNQPASPWFDARPNISAANPYRWITTRDVRGVPANGTTRYVNGVSRPGWGDWAIPALDASLSVQGASAIIPSPASLNISYQTFFSGSPGYEEREIFFHQDGIEIAAVVLRIDNDGITGHSFTGEPTTVNSIINDAPAYDNQTDTTLAHYRVNVGHLVAGTYSQVDVVFYVVGNPLGLDPNEGPDETGDGGEPPPEGEQRRWWYS